MVASGSTGVVRETTVIPITTVAANLVTPKLVYSLTKNGGLPEAGSITRDSLLGTQKDSKTTSSDINKSSSRPHFTPNIKISTLSEELPSSSKPSMQMGAQVCDTKTCGMSLSIPICVNGIHVPTAIVDSAAQVTLISRELYDSLPKPPEVLQTVHLKGISDSQAKVKAYKLKNVNLNVGGQIFSWPVYVAPISDPVLIGLDFLLDKHCQIDLKSKTLKIGKTTVQASIVPNGKHTTFPVARAVVAKRKVVPPNTMCDITIDLRGMVEFPECLIIEPSAHTKLLLSGTLVNTNNTMTVRVVNPTDSFVTLKPGALIGSAMEFEEMTNDEFSPETETFTIFEANLENADLDEIPTIEHAAIK